jgi:hypothetical protein
MNEKIEKSIEIHKIDRKYELHRLPNKRREQELLASIAENGITGPVKGILKDDFILLDGFKRIRCAQKLGINIIPIEEMAFDEIEGIVKLLKISNTAFLHILEQAKMVHELHTTYQMGVRDIAYQLERSTAWVSVRLGYLKETTSYVQEQVFLGRFPATCAAYTLRQFNRLNKISNKEIDNFVRATAGKNLSKRDINILADGYFKGGDQSKAEINAGNFSWILKSKKIENKVFTLREQETIKSLEIISKYINRFLFQWTSLQQRSNNFTAQASLLAEGIANRLKKFHLFLNQISREDKNDRS